MESRRKRGKRKNLVQRWGIRNRWEPERLAYNVVLLTVPMLHLSEECSPSQPSVLVFWRCSIALLHSCSWKGGSHVCRAEAKCMGVHPPTFCKGRNRS